MATSKKTDVQSPTDGNGKAESDSAAGQDKSTATRLNVLKTYKMYINGKFPRTESGRYIKYAPDEKSPVANVCWGSRKDFREAVVAARQAQQGWADASDYLHSQILYRIAEMLEGRRNQFVEELQLQTLTKTQAKTEVDAAIDQLVYFAGWCDKYQQVFSSVNPVNASYFNFSVCEPVGVVGILAPEESGLLGLVSSIAPVLAGGNTCVVLASENYPLSAITLAEVLNSSDVPGGVVNVLTGYRSELLNHFASHMDVNAVIYYGDDREQIKTLQEMAAGNVKRVFVRETADYTAEKSRSPYPILDTVEIKTTWHPVGL